MMGSSNINNQTKPELGRKLAALIRDTQPDHPLISPYAEAFDQVSTALEGAMQPRTKGAAESGAATGTVTEKDEVRDDEYRALYYLLLAYATQRHDPALRAVAQALLLLLVPRKLVVAALPNAQESTELETLLGNAAQAADQLAQLPGAPAFVAGLRTAQDEFARVVWTTPALRKALSEAVAAIHDAADEWDGVLYGYLGILRQAIPGKTKQARVARDKLLGPLRETKAAAKAKATVRKKTKESETEPTA